MDNQLNVDLAANEEAKQEIAALQEADSFEHVSEPLARVLRDLAARCAAYRHSIGEPDRAAYFERLAQGAPLH